MVYRFRVTYEDHEDVYRDIDIRAGQTFSDLHNIIQQSISFDNSKSATFYVSDDYWRRQEEISLGIKHEEKKGKRNEEAPRKKVIADYVNDPHQKFIYIFDPEREWTFLVQLLKILPADSTLSYPVCIKTSGNSPKQYKDTILPPPPPEDEDDEPKKALDEKEKLMEMAEEKGEITDDAENILPPDADEEVSGEADEAKAPGEDEDGESSDALEFDDDDEN